MARKLSRREFLRDAAGAAAGLGAMQVLAACAPTAGPQPATTVPPTTAPAAVGQGGGAAPT